MTRVLQPMIQPITSITKISNDRGVSICQRKKRISTNAAFCTANIRTSKSKIMVTLMRVFNRLVFIAKALGYVEYPVVVHRLTIPLS